MSKFFKYILFCLIATFVNLGTQRIFMELILLENYLVALIFGTVLGLLTKYFLDKFYIFDNRDISVIGNSRMFTFIHLMEFSLLQFFGYREFVLLYL